MNLKKYNPFDDLDDLDENKNPNETRYFNKFTGKEDVIGTEPYFVPKKDTSLNPFDDLGDAEQEEGWGKWALRTAAQIPQGIAQAYTYPADLINFVGTGEAMDASNIQDLRWASERAGIPFNENEYREAIQNVSQNVPTQSNIARKIEESTGLPLQPKTGLQKFVNFASQASALSPKDYTFKGLNTSLPRPVLGTGVALTAEAGKAFGANETLSDIASFGILKKPTAGAGKISVGEKIKPSGIRERGFEKLESPREVSQNKINKINSEIEKDFRKVSDDIVISSDLGNTVKEIITNPSYKNDTIELFEEAKNIAETIKRPITRNEVVKEFGTVSKKSSKGFTNTEYDKQYSKYMLDAQKDFKTNKITPTQLVEQYRINNQGLNEYFEPGASKALNRAKKDALLDQNIAIAEIIEKYYPDSNLSPVFKEGNQRWSKIKDYEAIDTFVNDIFKEGISYKKVNDFFDKSGYANQFKKALGQEGYNNYKTLMKDMLSSEKGYKMLQVAKDKGYDDLVKLGSSYVLHPKLALSKLALNKSKDAFRFISNVMLDKPKLAFTYRKAVQDLKSGNFKAAEKGFKTINEAVKPSEIVSTTQAKLTPKMQEPIEVKAEPTKPNVTKQEALKKFNKRKNTKTENLSDIGKMGKGMSDAFYDQAWNAIKSGKDRIATSVREPIIESALKEFKRGTIKNREDLKKYVEYYYKNLKF